MVLSFMMNGSLVHEENGTEWGKKKKKRVKFLDRLFLFLLDFELV